MPGHQLLELLPLFVSEEEAGVSGDEVPERVRKAEERRKFRQMLEDSSLGCPGKAKCGHGLRDHQVRMIGGFKIQNIKCRVKGCECRD